MFKATSSTEPCSDGTSVPLSELPQRPIVVKVDGVEDPSFEDIITDIVFSDGKSLILQLGVS